MMYCGAGPIIHWQNNVVGPLQPTLAGTLFWLGRTVPDSLSFYRPTQTYHLGLVVLFFCNCCLVMK